MSLPGTVDSVTRRADPSKLESFGNDVGRIAVAAWMA
jgi:hypothetical protein